MPTLTDSPFYPKNARITKRPLQQQPKRTNSTTELLSPTVAAANLAQRPMNILETTSVVLFFITSPSYKAALAKNLNIPAQPTYPTPLSTPPTTISCPSSYPLSPVTPEFDLCCNFSSTNQSYTKEPQPNLTNLNEQAYTLARMVAFLQSSQGPLKASPSSPSSEYQKPSFHHIFHALCIVHRLLSTPRANNFVASASPIQLFLAGALVSEAQLSDVQTSTKTWAKLMGVRYSPADIANLKMEALDAVEWKGDVSPLEYSCWLKFLKTIV